MKVRYFESIKLTGMKRFLYFNLMRKINDCMVKDNVLGNKFTAQQAAFKAAFKKLDDAMLVSRKSLLTPEIGRLDTQRIQEWRLLRGALKETVKFTDATQERAAEFVLSLFNTHGDIQTMRVNERTGALTNLCQDLTEKYAAQVASIGLTGFATQLSATNAEYVRLYDERMHEWSEYVDQEVQDARTATDTALEKLCIMVASGIITEGMAEYKHFVDYVNEAIKVAKVSMGASTSKPDGEDTELPGEEETPPSTEPGSGETEPQYSVAKFIFQSGESEEIRQLVGSILHAPQNTEGCRWIPEVPATMPAVDTTYNEVAEGEPLYTIAWYDKSTPIQWYELPAGAAVPEAPEPPAGHRWAQAFTVMPARDVDIIAVAI